jgi:hypothetical protein
MFDVQVLRQKQPSADAIASISGYYRRVTLQARPMNRLVAVVMLGSLAALIAQVAEGEVPRWASVTSLVLASAAVVLAATHTFANGARLGSRKDPPERQAELARLMLRDHVICLVAIVAVLVLQLAA